MSSKNVKVAFVLINQILLRFGLRVTPVNRLIFVYRVPDYSTDRGKRWNIKGKASYIVEVTKDLNKAFSFLKLDFEKIENLEDVSQLAYYICDNCPYITLSILKAIDKNLQTEGSSYKKDPELEEGLTEFINTVKLSHIKLPDFDFYPFIIYPNLRESVARRFFNESMFDIKMIDLKLKHQKDLELSDRFNSKNLVKWIPDLAKDAELAGKVSVSFVNHVTEGKPVNFPRYVADTTKTEIRREFESFYYLIYKLTEEYKVHIVDGKNNENVI